MSKHARDMVLAGPPRRTLDAQEWQTARERVALLRSARDRLLFFALLNYLERGWEIIRPLHVAANRIVCGLGLDGRTVEDVTAFIECDPIDVYRGLAHACMHAVPGTARAPRPGGLGIVADDAGDVARYLRILALGTHHPEFPPDLHDMVRAIALEMTPWQAGLADVLEPVEDCVQRAGEAM
jgi:hypothetical protein